MKNRIFSWILILCLAVTAAPSAAFAEEVQVPEAEDAQSEQESSAEEEALPAEAPEAEMPEEETAPAETVQTEPETPAETGEPGAETPSVEEEETLPEEPLETEPADTEPAETAPAETEPAASEPAEAVSEAIEEELVAAAPAVSEEKSLNAKGTTQDFVERMYTVVLSRKSEAAGRKYWADLLTSGKTTASEAAYGFFFSKEYKNKKKSNAKFVEDLYTGIMGREPEAAGRDWWVNALKSGVTREGVFAGFIASAEFTALCKNYGVTRGTYETARYRDKNPNVTMFAARMYTVVLGRTFDAAGLEYWCEQLLTKKQTATETAYGFYFSKEYAGMKKNVSSFLEDLYKGVMGRASDADGKTYWLGCLNSGMSRYGVFAGFAASTEFKKLCKTYGVTKGSYTSPYYRDKDLNVTKFITGLYQPLLGRKYDAKGLETWCRQVLTGKAGAAQVLAGLMTSAEYEARERTNAEFLTDLYQTALGRAPKATEKKKWNDRFAEDYTRQYVIAGVVNAKAFGTVCTGAGIPQGSYTPARKQNLTDYEVRVMRKILYAVESGGTVYGQQDYSSFIGPGTNTGNEVAITIGAGQWYATEARNLLNTIRRTYPSVFKKLDTAGIGEDLDNADWSHYVVAADSAKGKCIIKLISSKQGIICQDKLMDRQIRAYVNEAANLGITNTDAQLMIVNIRHLGGLGSVTRILKKTKKPYTLTNIYKAMLTDKDEPDADQHWYVGEFTARNKLVYDCLKKYITN